MTAPPRVLVAVGSQTLALRLCLLVEASGAEPLVLDRDAVQGVALVVAAPNLAARAAAAAPGVPMLELAEDVDWDDLRTRLGDALADVPTERDQLFRALAGARVLLVDDSVTFREYLRQELLRWGGTVSVCGNAADALARLAEGGWDCVLTDLVLPGMDGAELCRRAARLRRDGGGDFVLGVMSSREGDAELVRCLEAGADLFLGKAQDPVLIRVKLGAMLRSRAVHR